MPINDPVIDRIVAHARSVAMKGIAGEAREAAKRFLADSLAVGIAGRNAPWRAEILEFAASAGGRPEATVLGSGERLPLAQAAMLNAYQIHCQEFDCVHDGAVVHPMAVALPSLLGWAERQGAVSGEELLRAITVGVDIAVTLGLCSRAPMRFFRPANAGGFGATIGLAMLAKLDEQTTRHALGIYYGQCSGTMQAHTEATPQLAMQVGFAARSAVTAIELARRGMTGPLASISGPFGYFALFDGQADPAPFDALGQVWRIAEVSYKPFPSGRATHGGIDGLLRLAAAHAIKEDAIARVRIEVPPLVARLIGRPLQKDMTIGYARLCLPYVGAVALRRGAVGLGDFTAAALTDPGTLLLASRIDVVDNGSSDPNALVPQRVAIELRDGTVHAVDIDTVLGSPASPYSFADARVKFDACYASVPGIGVSEADALWRLSSKLEELGDVSALFGLIVARS